MVFSVARSNFALRGDTVLLGVLSSENSSRQEAVVSKLVPDRQDSFARYYINFSLYSSLPLV